MKLKKIIKKVFLFAKQNYIVSIFILIVIFTLSVAFVKVVFSDDEYIYAKVKVSQGMWWANTRKPDLWFAQSIRPGMTAKSLSGKTSAEILSVRYYPWWGDNTYEVFLTVRLKASKNEKTGKYTFSRSTIGVSSPIDLEFPSVMFSGTIMGLSDEPFEDQYIEKTITLEKKDAQPWEYDAIQVGDSYFDGEGIVFEILDKEKQDEYSVYSSLGNNYPIRLEQKLIINVSVQMKVREKNGGLVFGEEQIIRLGKTLNISTNQFVFEGYKVSEIE